jgi:hypothetical protein
MTDKDFEKITHDPFLDFDDDILNGCSNAYNEKISYIEKQQQKYIKDHEKIKEFDILTSVRRGEYKEIFDSYINYCLEKGEKPKAKHLFNIYKDIKIYLTTNIGLDAFINICNGEINYKEFFIDFEDLPTNPDNFSLITGNWGKYENTNVKITYSKLYDILNNVEFGIEKEINKIGYIFLEYIDIIEKLEDKNIEGKEKVLTDEQFKNYKKEHLTPKIIIDLIDAGQLEQEIINGKYKPITGITLFMQWLCNNGYEDCLNFNFFKKFIFYENADRTIMQYLKPCNFGVKRQKKNKK